MIRLLYTLIGLILGTVGLYAQTQQLQHTPLVKSANAGQHVAADAAAPGGGAYVHALSDTNVHVRIYTLTPNTAGTGFYFAGTRQGEEMIGEMSTDGTLLWARSLNISSTQPGNISELIVDSDGMLVGAGHAGNIVIGQSRAFVFRYNVSTNTPMWIVSWNEPNAVYGLLEQTPGGNYLVYANPRISPGNDDAEIVGINRANGDLIDTLSRHYSLGSGSDAFTAVVNDNGTLYAAGRFSQGVDLTRGRTAVAKLGITGVPDWVFLGPTGPNDTAFVFARDMVIDGDNMVTTYSGNINQASPTASGVFLQKNSTADGSVQWAWQYDLGDYIDEFGEEVVSVDDGYMVIGRPGNGAGHVFVLKTNKDGAPQWAKRLTYGTSSLLWPFAQSQAIVMNDTLYFGAYAQGTANEEGLVVKLPIDGNTGNCDFIVNAPLTGSQFTANQFVAQIGTIDPGHDTTQLFFTPQNAPLRDSVLCEFTPSPCDSLPDFVLTIDSVSCDSGVARLHYTLCNNGGGPWPAQVNVGIFAGNPVTDTVARLAFYLVTTTGDSCQQGTLDSLVNWLPGVAGDTFALVALVNDPGGNLVTPLPLDTLAFYGDLECDYANNIDSFTVTLPTSPVLDLGPDTTLCFDNPILLDAGSGFFSYLWQDSSTNQTFLAPATGGTFTVTVVDSCGYVQSDTIVVSPSLLGDTQIPDTTICLGQSLTYTVPGFDVYQWGPIGVVECDTCSTVNIQPTQTVVITFFGSTTAGCVHTDTFTITVLPFLTSTTTLTACAGDTILFGGVTYTQNTTLSDTLTTSIGCDSVVTTVLTFTPLPTQTINLSACTGDSIVVNGTVYTSATTFVVTAPAATGCDTLVTYQLTFTAQPTITDTLTSCANVPITVGGIAYTADTTVVTTIAVPGGGCDTLATYVLVFTPLPTATDSILGCFGTPIIIDSVSYNADTTVISTVAGTGGACDTTVTLVLTFIEPATVTDTLSGCVGTPIVVDSVSYTADTTIVTTIPSTTGGCDTTATLILVFNAPPTTTDTLFSCIGAVVVIDSVTYTTDTTITTTIPVPVGCDTVVTRVIRFLPLPTFTDTIEVAAGDTITIGGIDYTAPATVIDTILAVAGECDTIATYVLIVQTSAITVTCPADITVAGTGTSTTVAYPFPTITTTCANDTTFNIVVTSGPTSGGGFPVGTTQVCFQVTNECGDTATCCFNVTVTAPAITLTCPPSITVNATGDSTVVTYPLPTGTTTCATDSTVTFTVSQGPASGGNFPVGTTVVCFLATNACGDSVFCCLNVTVEQPAIALQCPGSVTVQATGTLTPVTFNNPTATTTCATSPNVTFWVSDGPPSGSGFPVGTTLVCFGATNACGDTAYCCVEITVVGSPINLQCPGNVIVNATGATTIVNFPVPTATTDCPASPNVTFELTDGFAPGSAFPVGTTLVCYRATNACQDTAYCCLNVSVIGSNPNIDLQCPGNVTVNATGNSTIVNFPTPTATTTCAANPNVTVTQVQGPVSGSAFPTGNTLVCFLATTACGDSAYCCLNVTVQGAGNPTNLTLTCPTNISVNTTGNSANVNFNQATATSDCATGSITITQTSGPASGGVFTAGTTPVCFQAVDACGSTTSCCFNVTVNGQQQPVCDSETNGCITYELLTVSNTPTGDDLYRVRVINNCGSPIRFQYFQVPSGTLAVSPANNSVYTAPSGRQYRVRNPNYSPFYSVRFRPEGATGISGGQSDIFEFTLDEVTDPYVLLFATRLENGEYREAHLFTCDPTQLVVNGSAIEHGTISAPVDGNYNDDQDDQLLDAPTTLTTTFGLFPNPTTGTLQLDLSAWTDQTVTLQVFNAQGARVEQTTVAAGSRAQQLVLKGDLPSGMYHIVVQPEAGERAVARFLLQRM